MLHASPLPGWSGRFFHTGAMTFAHYELSADATPLHEHRHEQEEVWNVVSGEVELTIAGESTVLGPGAVPQFDRTHSIRPGRSPRAA